MRVVYYDIADCIVIMYDITQKSSFVGVEAWLSSVKSPASRPHEVFLVGNKIDKAKDRVTAKRLAAQYAHSKRIQFHEVSALDQNLTNELLEKITFLILRKREEIEAPKVLPDRQEKVCGSCIVM